MLDEFDRHGFPTAERCVSEDNPDKRFRESSPLHVAGLRIYRADVERALKLLWSDVGSTKPHVFVLVNAQSASLRADFPEYAAVLEDPRSIGLPDGYSLTFGARWSGSGYVGHAPGPDVFSQACRKAAQDGTRLFLLGGADGVVQRLRDRLREQYPGIVITGVATPPYGIWPDEVSKSLAAQVRTSGAQILWLGVSAPKQEVWALKYLAETGVPTVCVGAAFDFLSGGVRRAPRWMRRQGLEWLHRLVSEPRRLWKRYLVGNVRFLLALARFRSNPPTDEAEARRH